MKIKGIKIIIFLVLLTLGTLCLIGLNVSFTSPEKTNEIVQKFNGYYRKFIKVTPQGDYVIQDFYNDGTPLSSQYIIKNSDDVYKATNEQKSIDGLYIHFEKNGSTLFINYHDGGKNGLTTRKNKNNNTILEETYLNGVLNGKYISWWNNGNKKSEGVFINGKEEGLVISWYQSSQKNTESTMKAGQAHGLLTTWFKNGNKKIEGNAFEGKEDGKWTSWHSNGNKSSELFFEHGILKKCSQFDLQEKVIIFEEKSLEICKSIYQQFYSERLESEEPSL